MSRATRGLDDFAQVLQEDESVVGILVFGSYVDHSMVDGSDLDLLVVRRKGEWKRELREEDGVKFDINNWPLPTLRRLFYGSPGDLHRDAFLFEALRSGKVLYDPTLSLKRFQVYARTHLIHQSHLSTAAKRADNALTLAGQLLEGGETNRAEIEIRRGARYTGTRILLQDNLLRIHPPKNYLPQLRLAAPAFYCLVRDVEGLNRVDVRWVQESIRTLHQWRQRIVEEMAGEDRTERIGEGTIAGVRSELGNAELCLLREDHEAAVLQVRYAALLLSSPVLRLLGESPSPRPSTRYTGIAARGHEYADTLRDVMGFCQDQGFLRDRLDLVKAWWPRLHGREGRGRSCQP